MGKSKELFMQEREKEENIQQPVSNNTGFFIQNKMWEVKSIKDDCVYRIWAPTYEQALEQLPMIESF